MNTSACDAFSLDANRAERQRRRDIHRVLVSGVCLAFSLIALPTFGQTAAVYARNNAQVADIRGTAAPAPSASQGTVGMPASAVAPDGCTGGSCNPEAAQTPTYTSLMALPAFTPEKRAEIDALTRLEIREGMARLASSSASLNRAMQAGDNAALQNSVDMTREALDEVGVGIAARRDLLEGKAPRDLAARLVQTRDEHSHSHAERGVAFALRRHAI